MKHTKLFDMCHVTSPTETGDNSKLSNSSITLFIVRRVCRMNKIEKLKTERMEAVRVCSDDKDTVSHSYCVTRVTFMQKSEDTLTRLSHIKCLHGFEELQ